MNHKANGKSKYVVCVMFLRKRSLNLNMQYLRHPAIPFIFTHFETLFRIKPRSKIRLLGCNLVRSVVLLYPNPGPAET